ncbi:Epoxide hydrolase 4 [Bulinus truncatus]|nr:Epoxide hydrolase 4 [Bulinus truncatus]
MTRGSKTNHSFLDNFCLPVDFSGHGFSIVSRGQLERLHFRPTCIVKVVIQFFFVTVTGFLEMSKLLARITLWLMASYYGVRVLLFILVKCWTDGVRRVFQWKPVSARPPVLDDPTLGTHGFLRLEDVQIHYVVSGPEDGPLMLLVHGFPEFWYSWRHQIREFQKDYRVVAVDQRGYGDSSKPAGMTEYCMKKLMGDLRQVIAALGYKRCVLVGHDWGGVVCWAFGRLFPDMVERLIVLNCPPSPIAMRVIQKDKKQRAMSWYMFFFQLPWLPEFYSRMCNFELFENVFGNKFIGNMGFPKAFVNPLQQEDVDAYKYTFSQPGAITPPINYYRARFRSPVGQVDYDMDFAIPVLVVWGVEDMALSLGMVELIEKEHPKIAVRRIEEAGHFVQMDRPDLVNKAIRDWLSG